MGVEFNGKYCYGSDKTYLGLELLDELEFSDRSYCFDTLVVWRDTEGRVFAARDSGCSCPSPFENYNDLSSFTRIFSVADLEEFFHTYDGNNYPTVEDKAAFKATVQSALDALKGPDSFKPVPMGCRQ